MKQKFKEVKVTKRLLQSIANTQTDYFIDLQRSASP